MGCGPQCSGALKLVMTEPTPLCNQCPPPTGKGPGSQKLTKDDWTTALVQHIIVMTRPTAADALMPLALPIQVPTGTNYIWRCEDA